MITARALAPVLLALALGATPLAAQRVADVEGAAPEQKTPDSPVPAAAAAKPDSSAPVSPTPDSNNNSPFDYRSSEKISEDLSVSFPVDI